MPVLSMQHQEVDLGLLVLRNFLSCVSIFQTASRSCHS